jgi:hypothetical protein
MIDKNMIAGVIVAAIVGAAIVSFITPTPTQGTAVGAAQTTVSDPASCAVPMPPEAETVAKIFKVLNKLDAINIGKRLGLSDGTIAVLRGEACIADDAAPKAAAATNAAIVPASAAGLTATITQIRPAYDDKYAVLVVVDNATNESFKRAEWSCIFYSNSQIVGQDEVYVDNNEAGKQSAKRTYIASFKPFDKSECRLKDVRR